MRARPPRPAQHQHLRLRSSGIKLAWEHQSLAPERLGTAALDHGSLNCGPAPPDFVCLLGPQPRPLIYVSSVAVFTLEQQRVIVVTPYGPQSLAIDPLAVSRSVLAPARDSGHVGPGSLDRERACCPEGCPRSATPFHRKGPASRGLFPLNRWSKPARFHASFSGQKT